MSSAQTIRPKSLIAGGGVAVFGLIFALTSGLGFDASFTIAVVTLCAIWWITEAIPIPMTACIPLAAFPLSGVISRSELGSAFGNPINFLLIGGFMLSIAMVKSNAHLRLASLLFSLLRPKTEKQIVVAFMMCSALLSMWISNAAAAMMLIPAALATLDKAKSKPAFTVSLLLGICYAASVGGLATPIGTPPNLVFMQAYEQATGTSISFIDWMLWGIPFVIVLLPIVTFRLTSRCTNAPCDSNFQKRAWQTDERRVLAIFVLIIIAWMTRGDPFGGWSQWFNLPAAHDGYTALLGAIALFVVPNGHGKPLLEWEQAKELPWGVILLVSGGIAISLALRNTGLISDFTKHFEAFSNWPIWLMIGLICLSITFITEIMSNTACAALMMPILAALAIAINVDPMLLMLPAAMTASCAFMMPMATAPNAIVFGTQRIAIQDMLRMGAPLNVACVVAVVVLMFILNL
ncbi:SLC13 family permease [Glaciecola siphonariae]|uniref:SLC13 family permease n=1 Tax=Glaciecola siphonariae TaxID=521012 RepID=A0ABV9LYB8_9ALTE